MGIIKAAVGSAGGTLADQWKEFFSCDSLNKDVLMVKGQKQIGSRSSNTKGSDNVISNGSGIAVADGQCMIIVEQGKIVECSAEPGVYTFDTSSEPSIFAGKFGESLKASFKTMLGRFTYGGSTGKDQRVYYFNTKEIIDNKFGTPNPVPFRIVDRKINLDLDAEVRCAGVYSYKISDPVLFYKSIAGNVSDEYRREELDGQLKPEFISALQPAFAKLSEMELRPNQIPAHAEELGAAMNTELSGKWGELRGISVVSVALATISIPEEYQKQITERQMTASLQDPQAAAANLMRAQAEAMKDAANNTAGAMTGFMGMGMAGGNSAAQAAASLFNTAAQTQSNNAGAPGSWVCECGTENTGKFCSNCGKGKPAKWVCECGTENSGNFCSNCGKAKPAKWVCECGTENSGKFCSNCGKPAPGK